MQLKHHWVNKEIKEDVRKCLETNENKTQPSKMYRMQQK